MCVRQRKETDSTLSEVVLPVGGVCEALWRKDVHAGPWEEELMAKEGTLGPGRSTRWACWKEVTWAIM